MMTSKERVRSTFARQQPDRVPLDYMANPGIDARLKHHFGLQANDDEGLCRALEIDFRCTYVPYVGPQRHASIPGVSIDEWGIHRRWIEHATGGYWDYCDWPLTNATLDEVEQWPFPSPDDYDYRAVATFAKTHAKYAVAFGGAGCGDIINSISMLRSMEQVLMDLATDEPAGLRLIDRKLESQLEILRRGLEAGRGAIDVLWLGEDLGTQRGPTISLDLFRRQLRPRLQRFVDLGKHWNIPVLMHSCGSSSWAFDDFAEMGIAAVDTLQPEAKDMAPAYLKHRFGDRLAFHGMISTAGVVATGTVAEVEQNCREILKIMMPGGGYAFSPTHSLQDNSPTANVLAMYRTAQTHGGY